MATVIVNQIITLNKMEYQEKEFHIIDPEYDSKLTGIHTFSHEKKLTMMENLMFIRTSDISFCQKLS